MSGPRPTPRDHLLRPLVRGGGYRTGHEAYAEGIPCMTLSRLLRSGEIERPQRGVYRLALERGFSPRAPGRSHRRWAQSSRIPRCSVRAGGRT